MSNPVQIYTTAPQDYDWGWTQVLVENIGVDNRGRQLRLVEVEDQYHADMQFGRYRSGMYVSFYEDKLKEFSEGPYPLVTLTPDKHVYYRRTVLSYKEVLSVFLTDAQMKPLSDAIDKLVEDKEIHLLSNGCGYNITVKGSVEFCESKIQTLTEMWNKAISIKE